MREMEEFLVGAEILGRLAVHTKKTLHDSPFAPGSREHGRWTDAFKAELDEMRGGQALISISTVLAIIGLEKL